MKQLFTQTSGSSVSLSIQWIAADRLCLGGNTSNFTSTKDLFVANPQFTLWRFEVVFTFAFGQGSSALDLVINPPPSGGSCSLNPQNGTTNTLFYLSCSNWSDPDGIKDYSLYSTYR